MLRKIVGMIGGAGLPVNLELVLGNTVADPVKSHVKCLGPFLLDCGVGDAGCCGIVGLDRRRWLRMSQCLQSIAEGAGFFPIQK